MGFKSWCKKSNRKRSSTGRRWASPYLQRSLSFSIFLSSPLFELFGLKLEAKKDPKFVKNHIFWYSAGVLNFLCGFDLAWDWILVVPGRPRPPKNIEKNSSFWRFFDFELFAAWVRFGTTLASKTTLKKLQKTTKLKQKAMLKTSRFFASLFLTFGVILGPKTGPRGQPVFCPKSPFLSILPQLAFWSVLDSILDAKGDPEWIKHLISDDLSASSTPCFWFNWSMHDSFYLDGVSGAPFSFLTFWKIWNGFVDAVSLLGEGKIFGSLP